MTAMSGSNTSSNTRRYLRKNPRRRGLLAAAWSGCRGGLAFCSAGNFSTGSAIALLLFLSFLICALDGVADVFLDGLELRQQPMRIGWIDTIQRGGREFRAQPAQLTEQRPRCFPQIQPVDAAVGLVAAPLDPAVVTQPIDQPRQGNRLHLHLFRKFRLLQP